MLDGQLQLLALAASVAVMFVTWLISLRAKDASLADVSWGLCFVAIGWVCFAAGPGAGGRSLLIAVLVTLWGLRLAGYIAWRHDGEDRRYRAMRKRHGSSFAVRSLFVVFLLQALIAWVVSLPVQVAATDGSPGGVGALGVIGALVCLGGLACEAIADLQLARFLAEPDSRDKVMDRGLWGWSRHPNYFGDATFWWGIYLIALGAGSAWWTAIGPIVMTTFLLKVSGVALTERTISSRRPGYASYVERTSAFVPLPPGRG